MARPRGRLIHRDLVIGWEVVTAPNGAWESGKTRRLLPRWNAVLGILKLFQRPQHLEKHLEEKQMSLTALRFLGCLALLSGCATTQTYQGPRLNSDQVARLQGRYTYFLLFDTRVMLLTLDDKPFLVSRLIGDPVAQRLDPLIHNYAEILPGSHTVEAQWCWLGRFGLSCKPAAKVTFTAEPGHSYTVDGSSDGKIWVVE